jgi:hypothetical protein
LEQVTEQVAATAGTGVASKTAVAAARLPNVVNPMASIIFFIYGPPQAYSPGYRVGMKIYATLAQDVNTISLKMMGGDRGEPLRVYSSVFHLWRAFLSAVRYGRISA